MIGRNITRRYNIEFINTNSIGIRGIVPIDHIQMRGLSRNSNIDICQFLESVNKSTNESPSTVSLSATMGLTSFSVSLESMNCSTIRRIINSFQTNVYVNAYFSDIRTLTVRKEGKCPTLSGKKDY